MGFFDDFPLPGEEPKPTNGHRPEPAPPPVNGATSYGAKALDEELNRLAAAQPGTRNDTLNRAAFAVEQLARAGHVDHAHAETVLTYTATKIGLASTEITATLRSARNAAAKKPRLNVPDPNQPPPANEATPTVIQAPEEPPEAATEEFWAARPVLGHIRQFAQARRVSPWALLSITLARVTALTPHFVVLPALVGGQASINLFVGIVGRSGAGKGGAEAAARDLIDTHLTVESFTVGSGEAIAHAYMTRTYDKSAKEYELKQHNHQAIFSVAEIDTLAAMKDRTSSTVMPELRKAWMGERLGFHYVDPAKRLPVPEHQYRLCLIAGIQPERAAVLLEDADGGTPQRFIWAPASDPNAPDVAPPQPPPWTWKLPTWPLANGGKVALTVCDTAKQAIDQDRLDKLRDPTKGLDGHALLARLKTAAALALLDQRADITDDDWDLADTVMAVSNNTRASVVWALDEAKRQANTARATAAAERQHILDNATDERAMAYAQRQVVRQVSKHHREHDEDTCSRRCLANSITSKYRKLVNLDDVIERAISADLIEEIDGRFQPGRRTS